jgi:hypothetical protein
MSKVNDRGWGREGTRPALEHRNRQKQGGSSPQPAAQTRPYSKPWRGFPPQQND